MARYRLNKGATCYLVRRGPVLGNSIWTVFKWIVLQDCVYDEAEIVWPADGAGLNDELYERIKSPFFLFRLPENERKWDYVAVGKKAIQITA